ncbi:MAG: PIG-L family deacetylase, partial [Clostridia bacterium]|nr:PIG-L family deacetylase [Clostridia bacterium]
DLIRECKPDILITHWKNSMHKYHAATDRIVHKAQFYAGLASIERKLPRHYAAGPYYAENWEDEEGFVPYIYSPISKEAFELWSKAIETHWFAVNSTSFRYKDYYSHLKALRGIYCRKDYAEAFEIDGYKKHKVESLV